MKYMGQRSKHKNIISQNMSPKIFSSVPSKDKYVNQNRRQTEKTCLFFSFLLSNLLSLVFHLQMFISFLSSSFSLVSKMVKPPFGINRHDINIYLASQLPLCSSYYLFLSILVLLLFIIFLSFQICLLCSRKQAGHLLASTRHHKQIFYI